MKKELSVYVDTKITRRHLLDTAVSLEKGDFNIPSIFCFEKENGGFDYDFKTAIDLFLFCLGHENPTDTTAVFFIYRLCQNCSYNNVELLC